MDRDIGFSENDVNRPGVNAAADGSGADTLDGGAGIPAEGFYEWREENGKKQPYLFALKSEPAMSLAGIWQQGEFKGEPAITFAIITDEPNELIAPYHDRMPLAISDPKVWLEEEKPLDKIHAMRTDVRS